uniref:Gastricsin n=1 Tax=Anthurium amnicola TaxID=1678845 RepID=A0A1D1YYV4_9ARAE
MRTIYTFIFAILLFVDVLPRVQSDVFTIPLKSKKAITRRDKFNRRDLKTWQISSEPKNTVYYGSVGFGPKGKEQFFPVMFDTGSADLWVMSIDCNSPGCNRPKKYDPRQDTDYVDLQSRFELEYIVGKVTGEDSTTTLNLNGFEIPKQDFGFIVTVTDDLSEFAYVGIMGMAPGPGPNNQITPINNLINNKQLDHPQYSFLFGREADNGVSELTIGGTNPDRIDGVITWSENDLYNQGRWLIDVDALLVNGQEIRFNDDREMFIDSGYEKIHMSIADAREVYAKIPAAKELDGGKFSIPCKNHDYVISLRIEGVVWAMDARDFIIPDNPAGDQCVGAIESQYDVGAANQWVVGTAFLKNVYTVFDIGEDEVGFAKIKAPAPKQNNPLSAGSSLGQNKTSNGSVHKRSYNNKLYSTQRFKKKIIIT